MILLLSSRHYVSICVFISLYNINLAARQNAIYENLRFKKLIDQHDFTFWNKCKQGKTI